MVAAATHSLCEAANAMVQGQASEEKLIASAKEVAGSTAALLVACRVKADPGSVAMQRLQVIFNEGLYLLLWSKAMHNLHITSSQMIHMKALFTSKTLIIAQFGVPCSQD